MKIAMVHYKVGFGQGGTETVIKNLSRELSQKGHEITIITNKGKVKFEKGIKVTRLPYLKIPFFQHLDYLSSMITFSICAALKILFNRYDIVHCHFYVDGFLPTLAAKIKRIPTVYSLHGMLEKEGKIAALASKNIAISGYEEKFWRSRGLNTEKIYIGVDPDNVKMDKKARKKIRKNLGISNRDFVVVSVSRPADVKGPEILYDVIKESDPNIKFILVGIGKDKIFKSLNRNNTTLYGMVPHEKVMEFYSAADAALVISKIESISLVMLESMSTGLPLIIATKADIDKAVTQGNEIVTDLKTENITKAIKKLSRNRRLAKKMGQKGRKIISKDFSWKITTDKYEKLYKSLVK